MSLVALSLAAAISAGPVAADPAIEHEIRVIRRRLGEFDIGLSLRRGGEVRCRAKRSSGDRQVDQLICDAAVLCLTPHADEWQAIKDTKARRADKEQQVAALFQKVADGDCFISTRDQAIAALAAERRRAQS